jgi:hypothetical protein
MQYNQRNAPTTVHHVGKVPVEHLKQFFNLDASFLLMVIQDTLS